MEGRAAAWTLFGVIIGFKAVGAVLILMLSPSGEAISLLVAMNWPFIVAAFVGLALLATFFQRLLRLIRARSRRLELIRQEWRRD